MTDEAARRALDTALGGELAGLDNFAIRGDVLANSEVTRFDLIEGMVSEVVSDVLRFAEGLTRKQIIDYDPSYQTSSSQVLVERLSDIPELSNVDVAIRRGDTPNDMGGGAVVAMAHAVGAGVDRIVVYRLKGAGIATRRSRGITLIPRDGVYRPIEGDVLFYEPRFDALTCGEYAYFTTVTLIQTKLQAPNKARHLARETLKAVTVKIRIEGYSELEQAVMDDPSMRAKMAYIARLLRSDPDYAKNLTTKNLVKFVRSYPDYDIPITKVGGKRALQFDASPQHRHQIPRLLADDYLHSYLTDRNYEAGSKQRVRT